MLVLDFVEEREQVNNKKKKKFFKKKLERNSELKRYNINVRDKVVTILELTEKELMNEDVLTLLKIYRGMVLVGENFKCEEYVQEFLFSPKKYYQRALVSSLINQIKTVNKEWKNIVVKIDCFSLYKEFYELVRISKMVTLITERNQSTEKFLNDCYYEYGAIVVIKKENILNSNIVYLDLNNIDYNGKLMIKAQGKDFLLYPDMRYFENYPEYQKLSSYNIEHNIICAAFSDK